MSDDPYIPIAFQNLIEKRMNFSSGKKAFQGFQNACILPEKQSWLASRGASCKGGGRMIGSTQRRMTRSSGKRRRFSIRILDGDGYIPLATEDRWIETEGFFLYGKATTAEMPRGIARIYNAARRKKTRFIPVIFSGEGYIFIGFQSAGAKTDRFFDLATREQAA